MIVNATHAALCPDWADYTQKPQVREAFQYFVGIAATTRKFDCSCQWKGQVREFSFERNGQMPYAFITNQHWLLFYFRDPAVRSGRHSPTQLARDFCDFNNNPNQGNEWTIKIRSICDVQRLQTHICF